MFVERTEGFLIPAYSLAYFSFHRYPILNGIIRYSPYILTGRWTVIFW